MLLKYATFRLGLSLAMLTLLVNLHGQGNFPFPTDDAEWKWLSVTGLIGPTDEFTQARNYVKGDTVFNGKHYTKAFGQSLCHCTCTSSSGDYVPVWNQQPYLMGGVREEAGKVYFTTFGKPPFNDYYRPVIDTLLYDFTLQNGDTLQYSTFRLIVTGVDTTTEGRKRIKLVTYDGSFPKQITWVEGIGFSGLLSTLPYLRDYLFLTGSCFSEGAPTSCPNLCSVSTSTLVPFQTEADIQVFPTIATDIVHIKIGDDIPEISFRIFNSEGKLLKKVYSGDETLDLYVGDFPSGLYHLIFEKAPGVQVSKSFIK